MKRQTQQGFTLIELVVVIVILGILAATALPKFINLSKEANDAAVAGIAGGAASAMAINYAGCVAKDNKPVTGKCVAVANCTDASALLQGGLDAKYQIVDKAIPTNDGDTTTCAVQLISDTTITATFLGIRAGHTP